MPVKPATAVNVTDPSLFNTYVPSPATVSELELAQRLVVGSIKHLVKPVPVTVGDKVTGVVVIVVVAAPMMVGAGVVIVTVSVAVAVCAIESAMR